MPQVVLVTEPIVILIAEMQLTTKGMDQLVDLVRERRPECFPDDWGGTACLEPDEALVGHAVHHESDNELLAELAGKSCYLSFGAKSSATPTAEYLHKNLHAKTPHKSVGYHAKMTFYFSGISRRMALELIRHYVGADRDVEGSPSQESTRFVEHGGRYVVHPRDAEPIPTLDGLAQNPAYNDFAVHVRAAHQRYIDYIRNEVMVWKEAHGEDPKGMDRKRIYEAASMRLDQAAETSLLWTTNPVALEKMMWERGGDGTSNYPADLEYQRFMAKLSHVALKRWPALFSEALQAEAPKWWAAWGVA